MSLNVEVESSLSQDESRAAGPSLRLPLLLFFVSGFAGLTYEVLWQRELGLLFGNTTHATATTLAVFFLGLGLGNWWVGRWSRIVRQPLRCFGYLEISVGITALALWLLLPIYRQTFTTLYSALGDVPIFFLVVKFALSALVLGIPAFLMGGTLPVLTEWSVRAGKGFARAGTMFYCVNTIGASLGAFSAAFLLPQMFGYRGAYTLAVLTSIAVGILALRLGKEEPNAPSVYVPTQASNSEAKPLIWFAALAGFIALGLQVLWTRMYALVFYNSVYTFAAVLIIFLASIALGALLAHRIGQTSISRQAVLRTALIVSAILACGTLLTFRWVAFEAASAARHLTWDAYLFKLFSTLALCMAPAAFFAGFIFPYILKVEQDQGSGAAGPRIGRLAGANTIGALVGSLIAGFVLPGLTGTWIAIGILAVLYLVPAAFMTKAFDFRLVLVWRFMIIGIGIGIFTLANYTAERAGDWIGRKNEKTIAVYEGSAGTVAVTNRRGNLLLRLNESYTLGGTSGARWEKYQTHIPMCIHGDPKRVYLLGMGTGITAGAALDHDVDYVRVAELMPEIVEAARDHFGKHVNGLFSDPRVDIVVEDGRTLLLGTDDSFDVVIGDLFLPGKQGTALLYTVEQFEAVKMRLAPGGVFAQWLALYQLSEDEFLGIARSFQKIFPDARVWRGDFFGKGPIVALVGTKNGEPLDGERMLAAWRRLEARGAVKFGPAVESLPFLFQAGALAGAAGRIDTAPLHTDDHPWIAFDAPISKRSRSAGAETAFVGQLLADFELALLRGMPVQNDPYLAQLTTAQQQYVEGGLALYRYAVASGSGSALVSQPALTRFKELVPSQVRPLLHDWMQ